MNPFNFERSRIPFLRVPISEIDQNIVGLFCAYNEIVLAGGTDFRPTYWGFGKVQEGLLKLLGNTCVSLQVPQYCGYQSDVRDGVTALAQVKKDFPPSCE